MTPDQISVLAKVSELIGQIGTLPIGTLLLIVVLGPYIFMFFISRAMEKRQEAALKMYETNVRLVEKYEQVADQQADTIRLATAATTELTTYLKTKTPCHQLLTANMSARMSLRQKETG